MIRVRFFFLLGFSVSSVAFTIEGQAFTCSTQQNLVEINRQTDREKEKERSSDRKIKMKTATGGARC